MPNENGWHEWSRHVLSELERLNGNIEKLDVRLRTIEAELVALKVKSGIWGGMAGAIVAALAIALMRKAAGV